MVCDGATVHLDVRPTIEVCVVVRPQASFLLATQSTFDRSVLASLSHVDRFKAVLTELS